MLNCWCITWPADFKKVNAKHNQSLHVFAQFRCHMMLHYASISTDTVGSNSVTGTTRISDFLVCAARFFPSADFHLTKPHRLCYQDLKRTSVIGTDKYSASESRTGTLVDVLVNDWPEGHIKFLSIQRFQTSETALLLEGFQASPVYPSGNSNMWMKTSTQHDNGRGQPVPVSFCRPQISYRSLKAILTRSKNCPIRINNTTELKSDSKRWTQFRTSIFPELYMVCEWST